MLVAVGIAVGIDVAVAAGMDVAVSCGATVAGAAVVGLAVLVEALHAERVTVIKSMQIVTAVRAKPKLCPGCWFETRLALEFSRVSGAFSFLPIEILLFRL
jgi:hypothetical protein